MAIIPADEKVFMVDKRTNTTYGGSQALQDMQQWYTMQDVADSVQPYKVFTALLTQNGGDGESFINGGNLTVGVTYFIDDPAGGDWTNVGAPNNNTGTYFIATGTTPNAWGDGALTYNTGAPVVTILENTIGNIWFTYQDKGLYGIVNSTDLFTEGKTIFSIDLMGDDPTNGFVCKGYILNELNCGIATGDASEYLDSVLIWATPIEIRVYN